MAEIFHDTVTLRWESHGESIVKSLWPNFESLLEVWPKYYFVTPWLWSDSHTVKSLWPNFFSHFFFTTCLKIERINAITGRILVTVHSCFDLCATTVCSWWRGKMYAWGTPCICPRWKLTVRSVKCGQFLFCPLVLISEEFVSFSQMSDGLLVHCFRWWWGVEAKAGVRMRCFFSSNQKERCWRNAWGPRGTGRCSYWRIPPASMETSRPSEHLKKNDWIRHLYLMLEYKSKLFLFYACRKFRKTLFFLARRLAPGHVIH